MATPAVAASMADQSPGDERFLLQGSAEMSEEADERRVFVDPDGICQLVSRRRSLACRAVPVAGAFLAALAVAYRHQRPTQRTAGVRNGSLQDGAKSDNGPLWSSGILETEPQVKSWGVAKFAPSVDGLREKCGPMEEGVDYQGGELVDTLYNVASASMCCAACAAYDSCTAWTWGMNPDKAFLTNVCWIKGSTQDPPLKKTNPDVMSGFPSAELKGRKHGVSPPQPSTTGKLEGVTQRIQPTDGALASQKCPGSLSIRGHGVVAGITTGVNVPGEPAKEVEVLQGDLVVPHMGGRAYFGDACAEGPYDNTAYSAINFLGKKMRWTTDISGAGCGCNAALYLVSMRQNTDISKCNDYYCDAMSVCDVPCAEIDLQEANLYSWMSTLHASNPTDGPDGVGVGVGYGGSLAEPPRRHFLADQYGPGARCVDTRKPFDVEVAFPVDGAGGLAAMEVTLSQPGGACQIFAAQRDYSMDARMPLQELTSALQAGMTPTISYWSSKDMLWMDGLGADGRGPCVKDNPDMCSDTVRFYNFSIEPI